LKGANLKFAEARNYAHGVLCFGNNVAHDAIGQQSPARRRLLL
jgi:hypothetical protein